MSRHHMTVIAADGAAIQLTAGWDRPLRHFFLSLHDKRRPAPDSGEEVSDEVAGLLGYDSFMDRYDLRSIGDVEDLLEEHGIPFDLESHEGAEKNPQLLTLLIELMNEKESNDASLGQKEKHWDAAPAAA